MFPVVSLVSSTEGDLDRAMVPQCLILYAVTSSLILAEPGIATATPTMLATSDSRGVDKDNSPVIGANLDKVVDYSRTNAFVDVAKQTRKFGSPEAPYDGSATVDALGWPTHDFGAVFITDGVHIGGTYKLSFSGKATVTSVASQATIQNQTYTSTTDTTTADVVVANTADQLMLAFRNTQGGIQDLKLIRPGYSANGQQTFTKSFLNQLQRFSALRFVDWTQANGNITANWSDRPKVTDARQSVDTKGVAWEYTIYLANQLDTDVWINVPQKATDDYVTQLARLLKSTLEPERKIYVEYSNELWNDHFQQTHDNRAKAVAEVEAGKVPSLMYPDEKTTPADWTLGNRRTAKRLKEISDQFRAVFGATTINTRVRPVLAGQVANPEVSEAGLEYIEKTYGPPKNYFYAIASAPYFGIWDADKNPNLTKDQALDAMSASISSWKDNKQLQGMQAQATYYGLRHLAYEGGPDTFGPNNITAKKVASQDPQMKELMVRYLNNWYSSGGGLFMQYVAGATNWGTQYGTWGLTDDMAKQNTPKTQGIDTVLRSPLPSITAGFLVPAPVDARAYVGATKPFSDPYLRYVRTGWTGDYLIRTKTAGTYNLKLDANTGISGNKLQVLVNGRAMQTLDIPSRGDWSTFADTTSISLPLDAGLNVVRLKLSSGDINIKSLKFNSSSSNTASQPNVQPNFAARVGAAMDYLVYLFRLRVAGLF